MISFIAVRPTVTARVSLSAQLRQAMGRTRTWTAPAAAVERERTRQVARIGSNLNQIARWANTYASEGEAVEVVVQPAQRSLRSSRDLRAAVSSAFPSGASPKRKTEVMFKRGSKENTRPQAGSPTAWRPSESTATSPSDCPKK